MPMWTFLFAYVLGKFQAWQASRIAQSPSSLPFSLPLFGNGEEEDPTASPSPFLLPPPLFVSFWRSERGRPELEEGTENGPPCTVYHHHRTLLLAHRRGEGGRETAGEGLLCLFGWQGIINSIFFSLLPPPRFCLFHGFCFPSPTCYCFVSKRRVGRGGGDRGCLQTPKIPLPSTRSPLSFLFMRSISQSTSKLS